jgi:peptidoglycan/LPS O-acetylase OafA/YrhL
VDRSSSSEDNENSTESSRFFTQADPDLDAALEAESKEQGAGRPLSFTFTSAPTVYVTSAAAAAPDAFGAPGHPVITSAVPLPPSEPTHLRALTALRFPAAVMIIVGHLGGLFWFPILPWRMAQAVTFFIVLSGFVLAYTYPTLERGQFRSYILARIARVWPVYVLAILLNLIFDHRVRDATGWTNVVLNLLMVQQWIQFSGPAELLNFNINAAAWVISTLFALYLLFPLLIQNWARTWHVKLLGSIVLVIVMIWACKNTPMADAYAQTGPYHVNRWIYRGFPVRLFEFVLGMCMALAFRRLEHRYDPGPTKATLLEGAAILMVVVSVWWISGALLYTSIATPWLGQAAGTWFGMGGVTSVFFAVLILLMALGRGWFSKVLSGRTFVLLGSISYSLYLTHPILVRYYKFRMLGFPKVPDVVLFLLMILTMLLVAHVTWALVERPARWLLRGRTRRAPTDDPEVGEPAPASEAPADAHTARAARLARAMAAVRERDAAGFGTSSRRPWGKLTAPGYVTVGVEVVVMVIVLALWVRLAHSRPNVSLVAGNDDLAALLHDARQESKGIKFGDNFELLGVTTSREVGGLRLRLAWKSLKPQKLEWAIRIHMLDDPNGQPLAAHAYVQDMTGGEIAAGTVWQETVVIPNSKLKGAKLLGIAVNKPGTMLLADRGIRDRKKQRILLPLGFTPAGPDAPPAQPKAPRKPAKRPPQTRAATPR